jgi:FkbM family methyltransferase
MYELLSLNIKQNNLTDKIIPFNMGVFCYSGDGTMNEIDLDGGGGVVSKRYTEENDLNCNFGGICLGSGGEEVKLTTIDEMGHDNIGFIHCDAQGSENFLFSKGKELIKKCRPVILFENVENDGEYLFNTVCTNYPGYDSEKTFSIKKYCMNELGYSKCIDKFNGGMDSLLIP